MRLGIKNLGPDGLRVGALMLPCELLTEVEVPVDGRILIGTKPSTLERIKQVFARVRNWWHGYHPSDQAMYDDGTDDDILIQLFNRGSNSLIVYADNYNTITTLLPGTATVFHAERWMEVRELFYPEEQS